jgi:hypothetical protein
MEWEGGKLCRDHQVGCCVFGGRGFDTHSYFLLGLPVSRLRGCCRIGLRLSKPDRLPGGVLFRLLESLRDRLRRGIWIWRWSGGGLNDKLPSDDVVSPTAQIHLLGRVPGSLSSRRGMVACGSSLLATLGRMLCKSRLRFHPLNKPQ